MKNIISIILIGLILSGCSIFRTHKLTIVQGNVITQEDVAQLRIGMSESQVIDVMGRPVAKSIFANNRLDYVYTVQPGYENMTETKVICTFVNGRLVNIAR